MKYIFNILFCCYFCAIGYAQDTQSIKADILLDSAFINQSTIDIKFLNSIEYTSDGFILLSSANQFYLLGIGGVSQIFEKWNSKISGIESFTLTSDNILMVVSGNTLFQAYSKPSFIKVMDIPDSGMGISSKYKDVYVFDQTLKSNKKDYFIYQLSRDKKTIPLVKISTPILSVFEQPSQLIFSTKNILFSVDIKTKKLYPIFVLPQESDIISIVGDTTNHAFYFSTDNTIYRMKNKKVEIISKDFGGILKYDGEGLVIFNPEKQLIVRLRNNILYPVEENLSQLKLSVDDTPDPINLTRLLDAPRNFILTGQISKAIPIYAQLVDKDNANSALLSEYAYALALGGIHEGALMNLDRAKLLGSFSGKDYFYAGQVFALLGYNRPAAGLLNRCFVPKWVYPKYNELYQEYQSNSSMLQGDSLKILFKRANYLASISMNFQAIALYEQMLEENPDVYLFHVGYSIPLEKVGLNKLAAGELESGISLMSDDSQSAAAKAAFNQRLTQLKQQPENAAPVEQPAFTKTLNKFSPKTMLYAGGMFSNNNTSFNARYGVYLSNSFNGSLNMGVSGNSTATYFNIGLSGYERLGNVVVIGVGLNDQIGSSSNVLSVVSTLGFSFINSKRNASWDIFFNVSSPLQQGTSSTVGISIGKSFYFGTR